MKELLVVLDIEAAGVAYRDGTLDDHHGVGVHLQHGVDDGFNGRGVEEVLLAVVVGRGGDDHELGIAVAGLLVEGSLEREGPAGEVVLNVVVLDWGFLIVDEVDPSRDHVNGGNVVVLCQQGGDTETDIAGTCYGNLFHLKLS